MKELYFSYPAIYEDRDDGTLLEIPDLGIGPVLIPLDQRAQLADIGWSLAAHTVQELLAQGKTPPKSRTLDDLEVREGNTKDAFLIELIGN